MVWAAFNILYTRVEEILKRNDEYFIESCYSPHPLPIAIGTLS
jgi:hypothetical protein